MSDADDPSPSSDDYKFDQTLIIWPFIFGASALAFFTTSNGFKTVLGADLGNQAIAYAISLFLVIVASYCSVQLGGTLANLFLGRSGDSRYGHRAIVPFILVFMLTASASGLFSYTFWHERFYRISEAKADATALPGKLAYKVMPDLEDRIKAVLGDDAKRITGSDDVVRWLANGPQSLITIAGNGGEKLAAAMQAAQDKARAEAKKRADAIAAAEAEANQLDRDIAELNNQLDAVNKILSDPNAEPLLDKLKAERDQAKQAADGEATGISGSGRAGCGEKCVLLKKKLADLEAKIKQKAAALKAKQDERDRLKKAISDKTKARDDKRAFVQQGAGAAPVDSATLSTAPIKVLQSAVTNFTDDPRDETLTTVISSCREVVNIVAQVSAMQSELGNVACDLTSDTARGLVGMRQNHLDVLAQWRTTCDLNVPQAKPDGLPARIEAITTRVRDDLAHSKDDASTASSALEDTGKIMKECIEKAKSIVSSKDFNILISNVEQFIRDNSPDRDEFQRSLTDLRAHTWPSTFGLLISAFVELSILGFKMLTDIVAARQRRIPRATALTFADQEDHPGEPIETRVYKALYRNLRPGRGGADEIREEDIDSDNVAPELRQGIRSVIGRIARSGRARQRKRSYFINHDAIVSEIEPVLARAATARPIKSEVVPDHPPSIIDPVTPPAPEPQLSRRDRIEQQRQKMLRQNS